MINILNSAQINKESTVENQNQNQNNIQNDSQKDIIITDGNTLLQGYSQFSDIGILTHEKTDNCLYEVNSSLNYTNQNDSCNIADELVNQNYISLATLKGKMSQNVISDSEKKKFRKNNLELKWQEGKVALKKGKEKITCNYAFTPTKSSLRVRCIYCGKIYSGVRSFISHRTRCNNKSTQSAILENSSQTNINSQNVVFNSTNNSNKEKLNNRSYQQIFNSGNNNETEYTQTNTQINLSAQNLNDDYKFSVNQSNSNNKVIQEEKLKDSEKTQLIEKNLIRESNKLFESENKLQNTNFFDEKITQNLKIMDNEIHKDSLKFGCLESKKSNFENFKLYLYTAMSYLPKQVLNKIVKRRNPDLLLKLGECEENISKEKIIELIFFGITSNQKTNNFEDSKNDLHNDKNFKKYNDINDAIYHNHQNNNDINVDKNQDNYNYEPRIIQICEKNDESENSEIEPVKLENNFTESKKFDQDIFQFNIPVFFRHSLPKFQDWICHICKVSRDEKDTMIMCENCGYVYHLICQEKTNEFKINDWFCDYCKTHGVNLKTGSKFQIGELVWVNYKNLLWPAQIIGFSEELFEILIFHTEKKIKKDFTQIISWSEGIASIDGLASKGAFIRESFMSIMHWQSIYKGLKYYTNALRSKSRRLPQINNKTKKLNINKNDKKKKFNRKRRILKKVFLEKQILANNVNHPLPLEIDGNYEIDQNEVENSYFDSKFEAKTDEIKNNNKEFQEKIDSKITLESETIYGPSLSQINCNYTQYSC